jgi:DNA-binding NarL/FixJ family response regulator
VVIMTDVRVLLVDAQAPSLQAMSAVVEEAAGFDVVGEALSGEQSLLATAELLPDLVLMDMNLPGMDGVEATSRLRGRPSPPVVLLLSTLDDDAGSRFVAWCGAAAYVTKSAFGPDQLRTVWALASD